MPRPKLYNDSVERHAEYRRRKANERLTLKQLGLMAQGQPIPAGPNSTSHERLWFRVTIDVNLEEDGTSANLVYVMAESELLRLQYDLRDFKQNQSNAEHGTYAFASSGHNNSPIPGMMTIVFDGLTIVSTTLIRGFQPPSTYHISEGAVNLLLSQRRRLQSPVLLNIPDKSETIDLI